MATFRELKTRAFQRVPIAPGEPRLPLEFSDVSAHLPVLQYYASLCRHVTEFGVRSGESTLALISGCKEVVCSYDIEVSPLVAQLAGQDLPCRWVFRQGDTASVALCVEETDLIFFDTLHTRAHLARELLLWGRLATRYIAFHDTHTCGWKDLSGPNPEAEGIMPAIAEFLDTWKGEYRLTYETKENNGLMVFERLYPAVA